MKGKEVFTPCSPGDPNAFEATLASLSEKGIASQVETPLISMQVTGTRLCFDPA